MDFDQTLIRAPRRLRQQEAAESAKKLVDNLLLAEGDVCTPLQLELLRRYRTRETERETIELALLKRARSPLSLIARSRIDETLLLLDHVHDPWIG